jgi:translation initiation factor 2 subunit 1
LAEKTLKAAADRCIAVVEESGGNGSFLRELDNN